MPDGGNVLLLTITRVVPQGILRNVDICSLGILGPQPPLPGITCQGLGGQYSLGSPARLAVQHQDRNPVGRLEVFADILFRRKFLAGPESDISQFAKVVTPLIPAPNVNLPQGNVELLILLPTRYDQQTYRVDEDLGPKDRVFGRFSSYNYTDTVQAGLTPIADILDDLRNWSYEASYTHIFLPPRSTSFVGDI